jgi:hypothetical protein
MKLAHLIGSAMAIACGLAALGGCQSIQGIGNLPTGDAGTGDAGATEVATCRAVASCAAIPVALANLGGRACTPQVPTCRAQDTSSYVPAAWKPPRARPDSCSRAQIDQFFSICLERVDEEACTALADDPANAGCTECLESEAGEAQLGAYIFYPSGYAQVNVAGCVALKEPCNLACAKALQAESSCALDACHGGDLDCSVAGVRACAKSTLQGADCGCGPFSEAASCYDSLSAETRTACPLGRNDGSLVQDFKQIALTLCGPCQ